MADTDFYKAEIERQHEINRDWIRVWIEASGLLPKLGVERDLENITKQDVVRLVFDRAQSLIVAYKQEAADRLFIEKALQELIQHTNAELSDDGRWVDISEGCFENASEFSIEPSGVSDLVKYLRQKRCCGDARGHNQDSGVECTAKDVQ